MKNKKKKDFLVLFNGYLGRKRIEFFITFNLIHKKTVIYDRKCRPNLMIHNTYFVHFTTRIRIIFRGC